MLSEPSRPFVPQPTITVLILVLVEHALGVPRPTLRVQLLSLNPCFSGTCSRSYQRSHYRNWYAGLNPCFSGTCSRRSWEPQQCTEYCGVLILVLVEHALGEDNWGADCNVSLSLNPCFSGTCSRSTCRGTHEPVRKVLILVLVEHALGVDTGIREIYIKSYGLNPCFSGTCSRRYEEWEVLPVPVVLILVLVEHALGVPIFFGKMWHTWS